MSDDNPKRGIIDVADLDGNFSFPCPRLTHNQRIVLFGSHSKMVAAALSETVPVTVPVIAACGKKIKS